MNYTEKYHLPQWEETDRIMRTDFNQMCADMEAAVNTCYSPDKRPNEYIRMHLNYPGENQPIYTFSQTPVAIALYGLEKILVIRQGGTGYIANNPDQLHYAVHLKLAENQLIATSKDEKFFPFYCDVMVFY